MSTKLKFGLVGTGVIAPLHAKAIAQSSQAELVAVADINKEKAEAFAKEYKVARVYRDYTDMFRLEDLDVVSVCTPSGLHAEVTIAAAESGIHVLCEKPLEINAEKMTKMIEACRRHKVKLGCVFQRRTLPAARLTRQAIQEGKLGKLVLGDAYLKYFRSKEYYQSADWRGTWAFDGGGALMNQGVHGIDLIQWMVGEVESVTAYTGTLVRDIEVEDTAVALVKYKNGAYGVIQGTTSVYPGQETRFEIHGENGTIVFGDSGIKQWSFRHGEEEIPSVERDISAKSDPRKLSQSGHYIIVEDMIQAVKYDREPMIPGEEARKAVDLILAIYESARSGKEVKVFT
ncbi:putative dehydrogenase [Caldalkalibacillus uzonensis]|uniref:Dehydrogenase n=1 Tax=Caldalkalibacillus uzonensis TaxID=353224 RepID=A0ABU0CU62_9BACI|nr:Gfo/Idh/MocA family oxidoreductase [Caldalkalibacillus uzonensis]MDQ0338567.1 putative dehydrogenase [Caldalkalibacillus uzonensis]